MRRNAGRHWIFGPFEFIPDQAWLAKHGVQIDVSPKPLLLLSELVERDGQTLTRAELLDRIWPDVSVSKAAFLSVVRDLRRALGENAASPKFVETVRGEGLRFCHPVHALPEVGHSPQVGTPSAVWETAAANLERALDALRVVADARGGGQGSRSRVDITIALARARWAAGQPGRARETFLEAASVARSAGEPEALALCAVGFAGRTDATLGVNREAVRLLEEALEALPTDDSALRAELLARLGTELYYETGDSGSVALTEEAVAIAERVGDSDALAYVLTARHFAACRPDVDPAERVQLAERAIELLADGSSPETLALALQGRIVDQLELGDGPGFRHTLQLFSETAQAIEQPFFQWLASAFEGHRALLEGELVDADRRLQDSFDMGRRIESPNAMPVFAAQLLVLRQAQDRADELVPLIEAEADRHMQMPVFRAGLAAASAAAGASDFAEDTLHEMLGDGLANLPRDQHWLPSLVLLASTAAELGSGDAARSIEEQLAPFAGRFVVLAYGTTGLGAVSHHLGVLAGVRGDRAAAARNFAAAAALHDRLGAPLWANRSRQAEAALAV